MLNLDGIGSALYDGAALAGAGVSFLTPAFGAALTVLGAAASSSANSRAASSLRSRAASSLAAYRIPNTAHQPQSIEWVGLTFKCCVPCPHPYPANSVELW